jgi:pimeloyl-ACP methyl ester carboxylesterase
MRKTGAGAAFSSFGKNMTTFVLVHGAWVGAWSWSRVAKSLRAKQHEVFAPTLTGLGEGSHLLNPEIDLETHILDVVNLMKWQDLHDVVLVGQSYAGMVVSGVAEHMEKSIASIVMLDAFFPADGQRLVDLQPAPQREGIIKAARDGITAVPPLPAAAVGVNENDRALFDAKATPQPIKCFLQPSKLSGARDRIAKRTYVRAVGYPSETFDAGMSEARKKEWRIMEIGGGHIVPLDEPAQLTEMLVQLA